MSFKVRLLLGATVPFVFALPAFGQVTISTATTAPIQTSTANAGAAADVTIASTGSITAPTAANTTVVTVNSSNTLTNAGQIAVANSDNSTGVLIQPGFNTSYSATGTINLLEDYTRTDTDNDKDLDGPVATGTGRTGILVAPGGTMTGNISLVSPGSITIEGNNSYGVSVRSALAGSYSQKGAVSVTGSNSIGLDFREDVSGSVKLGGSTSVSGQNSIAAQFLGDIGGEFLVDGGLVATGFTSTSISNYADPDQLQTGDTPIADRRDADDLYNGGPALRIAGDLAYGLLVNGAAVGGVDPTETVKDVVQDFNENRTAGSISSFGSSPALLISPENGAAGADLVMAKVRETILDTLDDDKDSNFTEVIGTFNYDYGLMNRGTISANGLNIGFASTAVRIAGSADGTHTTTIQGGIFNGGSISAQAFEADAVALGIGSGANTPLINNTGAILTAVNTETTHDAYGVRIDAGANVAAFTNSGAIIANTRGYDGNAVAFQDLSGSVTSFTNSSRIVAGYTDDDTTDTVTSGLGQAIALDLSHSGAGVTLTQTDVVDNARINGDVLFGAGADTFNLLSGEVNGDVLFGTGSDSLTVNSAKLFGSATFAGSGATVSLVGGQMTGDLALGTANGSISLTNSSLYDGAISRTGGGAMSVLVNNSTLNNRAAGALNISSMQLQNSAKMGFVINNARIAGGLPIFNVTGTADVAANSVFTPIFEQFIATPFTVRVLTAGTLNLGGPVASMLNAESPYLYNVTLVNPAASNALDLVMSVKTATQLGLNDRQSSAYAGVLDLLGEDDDIAAAITSISGSDEFLRGWSDLLPGSDAAVVRLLAANATAAFGATAHRLDLITEKPDAPGGAWVEEFGVYHDADTTQAGLGVSGGGFGVAAGLDLYQNKNTIVGAFAALESVEIEENGRNASPLNVSHTSIGAYGGWKGGNLAVNAATSYGFSDFSSDRQINVGGLTDQFKGNWSATSFSAGARATYTVPLGFLDVKPYIAADYMGVSQDGYSETATTNDNLAITASDSEATLATASYGALLVADFGSDAALKIRPQLSVGYRNVLSWDPGGADYSFAGGSSGTTFNLSPGQEPEDAVVAGLGLNISSQFLNMKVGYDTEISDNATTHYGSVTLRLAFW